jgi:signal transduction histidine kinase
MKSTSQYGEIERSGARRKPWFRRTGARLGVQGSVVICVGMLLMLAMGISAWISVQFCRARLSSVTTQQAQQLSATLALAAEHDLSAGRHDELERLASALVQSRSVLFVGFLDSAIRPVAMASRDSRFTAVELLAIPRDTDRLMSARASSSALLGDYFQIVAPVVMSTGRAATAMASAGRDHLAPGVGVIGYVLLGVSQASEQAQLRQIYNMATGIWCLAFGLVFPLAYLLVHRLFMPIRQLVTATEKISAGDLETQVAIDRPDAIGQLARAFNEMVLWVRQQRVALAAANEKLGRANQQLATANARLAVANRDLEAKVEQRTSQLEAANQRLRQEIAEKEDFLRAVSHDLNAPLRNISGMATMLLLKHREEFNEETIHRIERIKKNVEVETDLITELLELSRIKTRRMKMEAVEITGLVTEVAGLFEEDLRSKSIDLAIETALPVLWCERGRVRQVFQNLIDNSCKYMGEGPQRRIRVGCTVRPDAAEFYVSDTGQGIEAGDLDKIFVVFRRGRSAAAQNIAGKGIGLASVKSIVETYGGRIWAESPPGAGTTVRFTIHGQYVRGQGWPKTEQTHGADEAIKRAS